MRTTLAALALALTISPSLAGDIIGTVTPKQAITSMQNAGYWGIGGVTRNDPFYFAAAMSPDKKRVRVAVDVNSGEVVKVTPLAPGAGSTTAFADVPSTYAPPTIEATQLPATGAYYHPPGPHKRIGVRSYPYNSSGQPASIWCRYQANAPGC